MISTHVLDITDGLPAAGLAVRLAREAEDGGWLLISSGLTGADGRLSDLMPHSSPIEPGVYRLTYDVGTYFLDRDVESFYTEIPVVFSVRDGGHRHHIPLLLSPHGYTTYRGS